MPDKSFDVRSAFSLFWVFFFCFIVRIINVTPTDLVFKLYQMICPSVLKKTNIIQKTEKYMIHIQYDLQPIFKKKVFEHSLYIISFRVKSGRCSYILCQ